MKVQSKYWIGIFLPMFLVLIVTASDFRFISFNGLPLDLNLIRESLLGMALVFFLRGMIQVAWFKDHTLVQKLRFLGITVIMLWAGMKILSIESLPILKLNNPRVMQTVDSFNRVFGTIGILAVTVFSVWIFVLLKELIYVQQGKRTEFNFRFLIIFVLLQMVYALVGGPEKRLDSTISIGSFGDIPLGNYFFPFVILFAVINGFRCKWIHYLNKNQKIGFLFFFIFVYPFGLLLLLQTNKVVLIYSTVIGAFIQCLIYIYVVYASMSLIGILSLLPSAGLLDRRIKEIRSLQTLSTTVGSVFDKEELISKTSELALKVVGADYAWLELKEEERYHLAGAHGIKPEKILSIPNEIREIIRQEIKKDQRALLINDLSKHKETREIKKMAEAVWVYVIGYNPVQEKGNGNSIRGDTRIVWIR